MEYYEDEIDEAKRKLTSVIDLIAQVIEYPVFEDVDRVRALVQAYSYVIANELENRYLYLFWGETLAKLDTAKREYPFGDKARNELYQIQDSAISILRKLDRIKPANG